MTASPTAGQSVFRPQCRAILQVILDGFGDSVQDSEIQVIPIIPKSCTIHVNSYKQADSYELVFEANDLPFDPAIIRAGAAEIFLFDTPSNNDPGQRVLDRAHPLSSIDPGNTRPRSAGESLGLDLDINAAEFTLAYKPRIVGTFDDDDLEMSDAGKWVTIRGQDYTAFLCAIQFPPNADHTARRIPVGKRLDEIVGDLLSEADPDGQLDVVVRGLNAADLPIVHSEVATNKRGIAVEQATSYWDVIYKLVERYGFITFVDGLDVVISQPKTITDKDVGSIRRLAWGRNLEHLTLKRHLGKEQAPTQVVRCYVPGKGTLTAEFPDGQIDRSGVFVGKGKPGKHGAKLRFKRRIKERTTVSKKGKVKTTVRERDEYQISDVHGITDPAILRRIAENRYHLLGKAERTVVAKTRDLKVLTGDTRDGNFANLLEVAAGDAFTVEWDEFNSEMLQNKTLPDAAKQARLVAKGYQASVAATIVKHYQILGAMVRPLRFKEGTIEYDADKGVSIELQLQDFLVIDGIRGDSGAVRQPTLAQRRETLRKHNGAPVGWSAKYQAAQQRRFGK
ncbi:MAG TPA: hypothetical protein VLN57_21205 [Xanthobacteraceae bacterium]|nr:hypothetical protein [Xanthobacteraceae bacterium]